MTINSLELPLVTVVSTSLWEWPHVYWQSHLNTHTLLTTHLLLDGPPSFMAPGWCRGAGYLFGCTITETVGSHQKWDLIPEDSVSLEHPQKVRLYSVRSKVYWQGWYWKNFNLPSFQRLTRCCNALITVCGSSSSTLTQHTSSWGSVATQVPVQWLSFLS